MASHRTLADWLSWQERLHPRSMDFGLERVRAVAGKLGLLHPDCPVIIVGGTNGKGSCVALLHSLLTAGGYRVGAFTSPHLVEYNERIRIGHHLATDAQLIAAFEQIESVRGAVTLTFFEFSALAALWLFKQQALDAIILEVGLGGRLDAVNIIDADVALLTRIGLDHCEWLGPTRENIGREKAGIFRAGQSVVLGAADMPASVFAEARRLGIEPRLADARLLEGLPRPALQGPFQLTNAAAALTALEALRERLPLTREQIIQGLNSVRLRGRFEIIAGSPEWILDVAHNPDAAATLAANLRARATAGRTLAVVGILGDKDIPGVIAPLQPQGDQTLVHEWIAVDLPPPRGIAAHELIERCAAVAQTDQWLVASSVEEGCELALRRARPEDRIVVFGSFSTVGPALQWMERARLSGRWKAT